MATQLSSYGPTGANQGSALGSLGSGLLGALTGNPMGLIQGGLGLLGGLFGGKSAEQKLAERQQAENEKMDQWRQSMDRNTASNTAVDRMHGQNETNALNPMRRQVLSSLASKMGLAMLPQYGQWAQGQGTAPATPRQIDALPPPPAPPPVTPRRRLPPTRGASGI